MLKVMHIFTDGGAINNKQDAAGGSAVFFVNNKLLVARSQYGTNNICELDAIRYALRCLLKNFKIFNTTFDGETVMIHSDSMYSINVITGQNATHANKELVEKCKYYVNQLKTLYNVEVVFQYVKAHTGKQDFDSVCNAIVDRCANMYAQNLHKDNTVKQWSQEPLLKKESIALDKFGFFS